MGEKLTQDIAEGIKAPAGSVVGVVGLMWEPSLPERESFWEGFRTVESLLRRLLLVYGTPHADIESRLEEALGVGGLKAQRRTRLRALSEEERWLLHLAKAVLSTSRHSVLYTIPSAPASFYEAQRRIAKSWKPEQGLLLFFTESIPFVEEVCEYLVLYRENAVLAQGRIAELVPNSYRVQIEVQNLNDEALRAVRNIATKLRFEKVPITQFTAIVSKEEDFERMREALLQNGVTLLAFVTETPSLENFIQRKIASTTSFKKVETP